MSAAPDPFNLIITGVGGQGNVLASQILGQALVRQGWVVTVGETYGASQRGGSVMSHLRLSRRKQWSPLIPEGQAHLVVGLEPLESLRVMARYGNPGVLTLTNTRPIHPLDVIAGAAEYPEMDTLLAKLKKLGAGVWTVDATRIALELDNPILSNMAMLGALAGMELAAAPLSREDFAEALGMLLPAKALPANLEAFDQGRASLREI
ncbi:MAG: indolepyruvate oxidoreductase subunit beta [Desulfarculaceae bacterium]|nr:indolepyruvate oxidoreductase subunit beta [Desulfarculaceae bacterium]MCF8071569.1 indolepyruvate oxidoreductase subunit beta [Desulfarculaceae bacterium]MCF8102384.1 indolepyruvate oxidoreductase subunit beta [Desulfarculaceae bacterium]MCF8114848.1 indolepyruvate oxidoreductase subunit beta [Desulfarculaceae bacterium]